MRRAAVIILGVVAAVLATSTFALGAEVAEVADALANEGFYVERGTSISEEQAGDLVAAMTDAGEGFFLVVLAAEPAAGATTFADNVQFELGRGVVLVVAPESFGYAGEGDLFTKAELDGALDAAALGDDDYDVAAGFVGALSGLPAPTGNQPVPVPTTVAAGESPGSQDAGGGGGSGLLWIVLIGGVVVLFLWWRSRRAKAQRQDVADERLEEARSLISSQLADLANDILELEDEVRVADNERAGRFYEQAGQTYNEASDALADTDTAQGLVDLSNKVDVAIWQLDCAEAIIDDKPLPERPEPKRLEAPVPDAPPPTRQPAPPRSTVPGPGGYERRPSRRTSYGGGGLMDLLIVLGGSMLGGRRRSARPGSGGLGGMFGRRSRPPTPTPRRPTSSSRSSPVPGPGRPATPSSRPSTSRQRGTSGRVRGGRKRRRR